MEERPPGRTLSCAPISPWGLGPAPGSRPALLSKDSQTSMPRGVAPARARFALWTLAIAALSLALDARLAFASFPLDRFHDESLLVGGALDVARSGDLHPPVPSWGTLPFYALALVYLGADALGSLLGIARLSLDPESEVHHALARWASLGASSLAVVLTAWLGRRAFGSTCGLIAAGLMALAPLSSELAQRAAVDPWMLAAFTAATLAALRIATGDASRSVYVVGGVAAGLAAACKTTGGVSILAVLLAHALVRPRPALGRLGLCALAAAIAFGVANPYALLEPGAFLAGMAYENAHYSEDYMRPSGAPETGWLAYGAALTRDAIGPLGGVVLLAGLAVAVRRSAWHSTVLLLSGLVLFLVVGSFRLVMPRQVLAALPAVCVLAALPLACAVDALRRRLRGLPIVPRAALGLLALVPATTMAAQRAFELGAASLPGTREMLVRWLDENVPDGACVALEVQTPGVETLRARCEVHVGRGAVFPELRAVAGRADFVVVSAKVREGVAARAEHLPEEARLFDELFTRVAPSLTLRARPGRSRGPTYWVFGSLPDDLLLTSADVRAAGDGVTAQREPSGPGPR